VRPDGEDGLRALLLADAALEASRTGRSVRPAEM
jgi:predicted dehydrogenase